jgi:BirA family transcriptional regulator, biotin operon repressor / biotin---[acetyl-CoA-carboxylase] ligase
MTAGTTDRKIDKLIHLLVMNATVIVPGPKIASEIGVSRATVWTWIEKLRAMGVEIKGHAATGYQLSKLPDILAPSLIRPELGETEIGHRIVHFFKTDSTNHVANKLANEDAPHGTVVLAEEQTSGRGRFGRAWYSEKSSGIYCSIILRPKLPPALAPAITLMAGVAAHRALSRATGLKFDIRWPNDLLTGGKKVCGILTEMSADLDCLHHVVLGIGINVNHREIPADLSATASSLRIEAGKSFSRINILVVLLKEIERLYTVLLRDGTAPVAKAWAAASGFAEGKRVRVTGPGGPYTATTAGLDPSGALRVRKESGEVITLISGEVVETK